MIDIEEYEGHNRMYAMRCKDDKNYMLFFIEDWCEHMASCDEWWPELSEKFGKDHHFSINPHRFYSNMECEHAWEGISEVNLKLMAAGPDLLAEVKRLRDKLFEAETHIDPFTDDYTFENNIRELHYIEEVKE